MDNSPSICWFRLDLRLADNPALNAAIAHGGPVIPVFIWAPEEEDPWTPGAASRWWLHHSLKSLDADLKKLGSRLIVRRGPTANALESLAKETRAAHVFYNRRYEPNIARRDQSLVETVSRGGLELKGFHDSALFPLEEIQNRAGSPFQVFTPFWKTCLSAEEPPAPLAAPSRIAAPQKWPASIGLNELELLPTIDWAAGMRATWQPGVTGAEAKVEQFCEAVLKDYTTARDRPDQDGTSQLSPHLHFGEISPRQVWYTIKQTSKKTRGASIPGDAYLRQLGWGDFAIYLLHHFPHTASEPLRSEFSRFPWEKASEKLRRWQKGETGFAYIDAGMRQLWTTGWMHNRVRMAVASFLVKDLLISWTEGAKWFWDTLVDADLANNTLGWQWTAGCGADAAPYFRVFNPVSQGENFDPQGEYVRTWVPELRKLPAEWIHEPSEAPADVLAAAGVKLGETYPEPIVDHDAARKEALAAFQSIRQKE